MKTGATEANNGHNVRSTPKNRKQARMSSANYIAVLAILNAMLQGVSNSLPQIWEATRMLPDRTAIFDTSDKVDRCAVSR